MIKSLSVAVLLLLSSTATSNKADISEDKIELSTFIPTKEIIAEIEKKEPVLFKSPEKAKNISKHERKRIEEGAKAEDEKSDKPKKPILKEGEEGHEASRPMEELVRKHKSLAFKQDDGIDMDISSELMEALEKCPNKDATITSGKRHSGYKKSLHRCGKAVDIHYSEDFTNWLLSESGESWLNENKLEFFIESKRLKDKNDLPERFQKRYRYIAWATGNKFHIHLNLKR